MRHNRCVGSGRTYADSGSLARGTTAPLQSRGKSRACPCGKRLHGRAPTIKGVEVCGRCELRHHRGLPQLQREEVGAASASVPHLAASSRAPSPLPFDLPAAPPGVAHATRAACSGVSLDDADEVASISATIGEESTMGQATEPASRAPSPPPLCLLHLTPKKLNADLGSEASHQAGLAATADAAICTALRNALHLAGAWDTPLPSAVTGANA